jgi:hypothetical protein
LKSSGRHNRQVNTQPYDDYDVMVGAVPFQISWWHKSAGAVNQTVGTIVISGSSVTVRETENVARIRQRLRPSQSTVGRFQIGDSGSWGSNGDRCWSSPQTTAAVCRIDSVSLTGGSFDIAARSGSAGIGTRGSFRASLGFFVCRFRSFGSPSNAFFFPSFHFPNHLPSSDEFEN